MDATEDTRERNHKPPWSAWARPVGTTRGYEGSGRANGGPRKDVSVLRGPLRGIEIYTKSGARPKSGFDPGWPSHAGLTKMILCYEGLQKRILCYEGL